ncbi:MAG: hypothetical protein U0075_13100 [Thermomicrobiales bacterium]
MSTVSRLDTIIARSSSSFTPLLGIGSAANPPQGVAFTMLPLTTTV